MNSTSWPWWTTLTARLLFAIDDISVGPNTIAKFWGCIRLSWLCWITLHRQIDCWALVGSANIPLVNVITAEQCCERYYLEDSMYLYLKDTRYYASCIFKILLKSNFILYLQDTFEKYLDKEEDTFHKILFACCVRYSTQIITLHDYMECQKYWSTNHPIIVSQQIHARLIWRGTLKTES